MWMALRKLRRKGKPRKSRRSEGSFRRHLNLKGLGFIPCQHRAAARSGGSDLLEGNEPVSIIEGREEGKSLMAQHLCPTEAAGAV